MLHKRSVDFFISKNLTKNEWIIILEIFESKGAYEAADEYRKINKGLYKEQPHCSRKRIRDKYSLVQNKGIEALNRRPRGGRPKMAKKKRDDSYMPSIINDLNEEQKREIIVNWIKEQRDKKKKEKLAKYKTLTIVLKSRILQIHRTTFYLKPK